MSLMHSTKQKLMLTAERLFAEHGIQATSMRGISAAAGQKNNSALQYHFGGKQRLLRAIVGMRQEPINRDRELRVIELERKGLGDDLHTLLAAMIDPFMQYIAVTSEARHYLGFISHYYLYAGLDKIIWSEVPRSTVLLDLSRRVRRLLLNGGPDGRDPEPLPPAIVEQRFTAYTFQIIGGALAFQRSLPEDEADRVGRWSRFSANLIDMTCGALSWPPSAITQDRFDLT